MELGDDGAVGLYGQRLRGVPAFLLDVPGNVGGETDSNVDVLLRFTLIDAERAGQVRLQVEIVRLGKLQSLDVNIRNAIHLVMPHFAVMRSVGHEVQRAAMQHDSVRMDVVGHRLGGRLRLVRQKREPVLFDRQRERVDEAAVRGVIAGGRLRHKPHRRHAVEVSSRVVRENQLNLLGERLP